MIAAMADVPAASVPPIPLRAPPPAGEPVLEGDVVLKIADEAVAFHLEVPEAPTTLEALLPVFQGLSNEVARRAAAKAVAGGKAISCRAGCGACCRQAVPVAEAEAHMIAALVASRLVDMPDGKTVIDVGTKYFGLGVACPFLEAESCSIHPDRPLRCREYFVTTPAAACAAMVPGTIDKVPLPGVPSKALFAVGAQHTPEGWLLLTQSLSFAERYPEPSAARPAPDWIGAVVGGLAAQ
jgi:hypothetical protein